MTVTLVGHSTGRPMLDAVRSVLDGADEAILCSAFVKRAGVHLVTPQLQGLGDRARLVATSTFGGPSTTEAFGALADLGARLRVANPGTGTFHPKLYVSRSGGRGRGRALVGSANLTGGLISNVEAAALVDTDVEDPLFVDAWSTAESYWAHEAAELWQPVAAETTEEVFAPAVLADLRREVERDPVFLTVTSQKPNYVTDVTPAGVWIETERTLALGRPPQHVPAWMFELAVNHLDTHGELSNRYLLDTDGLNVKRSSAVCAILARLPGVEVRSRRPLVLGAVGWSGRAR